MISPLSTQKVRVTHIPSGESVTVEFGAGRSLRDARMIATLILRSRITAGTQSDRVVRTYEADERGMIEDPLNHGEWL